MILWISNFYLVTESNSVPILFDHALQLLSYSVWNMYNICSSDYENITKIKVFFAKNWTQFPFVFLFSKHLKCNLNKKLIIFINILSSQLTNCNREFLINCIIFFVQLAKNQPENNLFNTFQIFFTQEMAQQVEK